jgi:hypothetical protein
LIEAFVSGLQDKLKKMTNESNHFILQT